MNGWTDGWKEGRRVGGSGGWEGGRVSDSTYRQTDPRLIEDDGAVPRCVI